ncbi:MAG: sensor domain-containing diguanylate cyclase [Candidatus Korobacteraceae bacterium]
MIDKSQQSYELQIFHDVAKALTSSLDLDIVLQTILEKIAAYFRPTTWALLMLDGERQELFYSVAVGQGCDSVNALKLKTGQSLARWVIETGEPLVISDVNRDTRIEASSKDEFFLQPSSIVCMPVRTGGKVLGLMQLVNSDMQIYQRGEMLLQALADYAAIAIENARAMQRIQELSITDDCTGLYNARHLTTVLAEEVPRSQRFGYEFSVLFLDLDHFKRINDEYGHLNGSKLLAQFGRLLRENLRLVDAAFRYGGDEFVVLLPQTGKDAAIMVARRLMTMFTAAKWHALQEVQLALTASIGIASYPHDGSTSQAIVQLADDMMYRVKQSGRDNIAVAGMGLLDQGDRSDGHN